MSAGLLETTREAFARSSKENESFILYLYNEVRRRVENGWSQDCDAWQMLRSIANGEKEV